MKVSFKMDMGDFAKKVESYAKQKPDQIKKVVKETAETVTTNAVSLAPVDTSNLKNSISASYFNQGLTAFIGTPVHYAPHVEFGTVYMSAQSFLFPSHETELPNYITKIKNVLKEI